MFHFSEMSTRIFTFISKGEEKNRMGNWSGEQEAKKEIKEKDKIRKEKLAGYFFNLSQLTFVAPVLGGVTPIYTNSNNEVNWYVISGGAISTYMFAFFANRILK